MLKLSSKVSNHKILLLLIILLSFILRYVSGELLKEKQLQKSFYDDIATNIINHKSFDMDIGWGKNDAVRQPIYPLILSLVYILFGKSIETIILLHSIIGTTIVYMTFLIAKQLFNEKIGLLSAFITMSYPYYVVNTTAITDGPLFTLILSFLILTLLKSFKFPSFNKFLLAGFVFGIATLCRGTILPMLFFIIIGILFILRAEITKKIKFIFSFLFIFLIVIMPWLIKNYIVLGKPVITSSFGTALWLSNHPDLLMHGYPEITIDYHYYQLYEKIPPQQKKYLLKLTVVKRDKFFYQEAIANIKKLGFCQYLKMVYIKFKSAYSWNLNPKYDLQRKPTGGKFKFLIYKITYTPILFIAIIGIYLNKNKFEELYIIFSLFVSLTITFVILWSHTQYRTPLDIYLIIFSAEAIFHLKENKIFCTEKII